MHGSSPAAWTGVIVCLVGFLVGAIGLVPDPNWVVFTIGVVVAIAAGPIALIMSSMGFGADRAPEHEH